MGKAGSNARCPFDRLMEKHLGNRNCGNDREHEKSSGIVYVYERRSEKRRHCSHTQTPYGAYQGSDCAFVGRTGATSLARSAQLFTRAPKEICDGRTFSRLRTRAESARVYLGVVENQGFRRVCTRGGERPSPPSKKEYQTNPARPRHSPWSASGIRAVHAGGS